MGDADRGLALISWVYSLVSEDLVGTMPMTLKIEAGQLRVEDAKGQPPTIPFWFGEAPGRSDELSLAVSRLRAKMDELLSHVSFENMEKASAWLMEALLLPRPAAEQLTEYLATAKGVLGALPSQEKIIFERFFDESGGMQFIVHSTFGSRLNRAWINTSRTVLLLR